MVSRFTQAYTLQSFFFPIGLLLKIFFLRIFFLSLYFASNIRFASRITLPYQPNVIFFSCG